MKRFFSAVVLCTSLLAILSLFLFPHARAEENPLLTLLNLPAPPPYNPLVTLSPQRHREDFYSRSKPPGDDAPIEDLLDYWRRHGQAYLSDLQYKLVPSEKVLDRLIDEIKKDPSSVVQYLNVLPEGPRATEFVKGIYDDGALWEGRESDGRPALKRWLTYHSPYFSSELARVASRVTDANEYVTHHKDLLALGRVDWDAASPIVSRLYNSPGQPASRTAALWALYRHALDSGSPGDIERYRDELKTIVADKTLIAGVRDLALDALVMERDWEGRDDWYYGLLHDQTLVEMERFTGLTTIIMHSPDEKYVDKMIALLKSDNLNVRSAAARNLLMRLQVKTPEIVEALLPWLENPQWLKDNDRNRDALVRALHTLKMPESVPGLIAALDEKATREIGTYPNSNMNSNMVWQRPWSNSAVMANTASNSAGATTVTYYPLRNAAIGALGMQGDMRAVPALRRILPEVSEYERVGTVNAILKCNGFSVSEQVEALEAVAKEIGEAQGRFAANVVNAAAARAQIDSDEEDEEVNEVEEEPQAMPRPEHSITAIDSAVSGPLNAAGLKLILGTQVAALDEPGEDLVQAVVERVEILDQKDSSLAESLRKILLRWKGSAINALLLRDLKSNKLDADAIVKLLSLRRELREKQLSEIYGLRTGSQAGIGISACLIEDVNDYDGMLTAASDEVKIAMLACARLIRAPLLVQKVAANLNSQNKLLAIAAERYLESEDSSEARAIVLSLHPNEAKILGATVSFQTEGVAERPNEYLFPLFSTVNPYFAMTPQYSENHHGYNSTGGFSDIEKRLRKEVRESGELLGIYSYDQNYIRIYKDKAIFSWEEDTARYRERSLTKEEFEYFKGFVTHHKADQMPPFLSCMGGCETKQLLMLGRNGGRRVFVKASPLPPFFMEMEKIFEDFRRPPASLKYWASKDIPGLEILFADESLDAVTVWKNGADLRLLTADKAKGKQIEREISNFEESMTEEIEEDDTEISTEESIWEIRQKRAYENHAWFSIAGGQISGAAAQPAQAEFIPIRDSLAVQPDSGRWRSLAGNIEIRANSEGLYKLTGGKLAKIKTGSYSNPLITANGRWVIASKDDDDAGSGLVRINLLTNIEFKIESDEHPDSTAVAYIASINRVMLGGYDHGEHGYYHGEGGAASGRSFSLLDPETGVIQPTRGEVRPIAQQKFRPLQQAGNAFEFWAASPNTRKNETVIGIYDTRTFTIKPLVRIQKINFDSMDMWVDAAEDKAYFVYEGHLLAVPLGQNTVPKPSSARSLR